MTTDHAGSVRGLHRARTRRASFRAWRRSRPFWGGLLLTLAGLELLAIPLSGILLHGMIKLVIYIGIGGVFGVLIGILLIAAGVMLLVNPVHRAFYGIAGIALGIVSFPASNLGGFLLGMLLAIIGGCIGFAWTPAQAQSVPAEPAQIPADDEPSAGIDLVTGAYTEPAGAVSGAGIRGDDVSQADALTAEPSAELSAEPAES